MWVHRCVCPCVCMQKYQKKSLTSWEGREILIADKIKRFLGEDERVSIKVLHEQRSLVLVRSEVSRQEYHSLSNLVLEYPRVSCKGYFPEARDLHIQPSIEEIDRQVAAQGSAGCTGWPSSLVLYIYIRMVTRGHQCYSGTYF